MKFTSITIDDVLNTKHVEFSPKSLTLITGRNKAGKSSIIEAFRYFFKGGHEPGMIREGAKKGVIRFTFDDDGKTKTITKTILPSGNRIEIEAEDFVGEPATYIKALADATSFDPGKLLAATTKDIVAELLEVLPLEFTAADLPFLEGEVGATYTLADIDGVRKQIYDSRRDANKAAKKFEAHCLELRKALPSDDDAGDDWAAVARKAEAARQALQVQEAAAKDKADAGFVEAKARLDEKYAADLAALKFIRDEAKEYAKKKFEDDIKALIADEARAQERAQHQSRAVGTREAVEKARLEAVAQFKAADQCEQYIKAIDQAKAEKLKNLPIQGLEFTEDGLKVDGFEWQFVNTAKKVAIVFQIAVLKAAKSKVNFMLMDGYCEQLDSETWKAFCDYVKASDWQVFCAIVDDGPLSIRTEAA